MATNPEIAIPGLDTRYVERRKVRGKTGYTWNNRHAKRHGLKPEWLGYDPIHAAKRADALNRQYDAARASPGAPEPAKVADVIRIRPEVAPAVPRHHTKDKGDLGVGMILADLKFRGIHVAIPLSEHLPFDLIAIGPDMTLARLQCRYARKRNRSVRVSKNRLHLAEIDGVAIYCPDTSEVYYVPADRVGDDAQGFKDPLLLFEKWRPRLDSNQHSAA